MDVLKRNNVNVSGRGDKPILFAHGFGCDQNMWRYVTPAFENNYKLILFDHVGAGDSDLSAYSFTKYDELEGYAKDIVEIVETLDLQDVIFVGHSVSAIMGLIAANMAPDRFSSLIMVGPSPSYMNDGGYHGGFTRTQLDELLDALASNHLGWSMSMAPVIMGNAHKKELSKELANSFCRTDPKIAQHFARTTFLSDKRALLETVSLPTLLLQCSNDVIAPLAVGQYMHEHIPQSELIVLNATGHCPHLSAPDETIAAIESFLLKHE